MPTQQNRVYIVVVMFADDQSFSDRTLQAIGCRGNPDVPINNTDWSRPIPLKYSLTWCCHDMETVSVLLTLCEGNQSLADMESPYKGPEIDDFLDINLKKLLNKKFSFQWFETLWRSCDVTDDDAYKWSTCFMCNFVQNTSGVQSTTRPQGQGIPSNSGLWCTFVIATLYAAS